MNKCGTCKYWNPSTLAPIGRCYFWRYVTGHEDEVVPKHRDEWCPRWRSLYEVDNATKVDRRVK